MKSNRVTAIFLTCSLLFSLTVAQGDSNRARLKEARSMALPVYAVLDEHAQPVIAASGKVGFISSVTAGSLISFSVQTGKRLSAMVVGATAGPVSMVETRQHRLLAVPAANAPQSGHPATVSIIDARNARQLALRSLLFLPTGAHITPNTQAYLTRDGRFCVIASSFHEPALYSFNVETGEIVSQLPLLGRASEVDFYEDGSRRTLAVASAVANTVSIIRLDENGQLISSAVFSPTDARIAEGNNPAFSADGRALYIAATGDFLFALDAETGAVIDRIAVSSPRRITVAAGAGGEVIGVTRIRPSPRGEPGGVSVIANRGGKLSLKSAFNLPERMEFSRANNIAFDSTAAIAFIGSATGMLFAFNAETGEIESYHPVGSELRRIALSEKSRTITAVRSTAGGDEIVVVDFETGEAEEAADGSSPVIESLQPSVTGQGRLKDLRLTVVGRNFAEGAALVVNGSDVPARLAQSGNALEAKLDKSLFDQPGEIQIRVKNTGGEISEPAALRVVRPNTPAIDKIKPAEVPGPAEEFTLKVTGMHFRSSSAIYVGNTALPTEALGETELQARVPADIARTVKKHRVTVRDRALRDLISNETRLDIYGPRVSEIKPRRDPVAGTGAVVVIVRGENFRQGAQVAVKGEVLPAERVTRISSSAIKVSVPGRMTQEAGTIPVIVRNKEGGESEPKSFDALPPKITGFDPAQTLAGVADVKIGIQGEHFRKRAKVFVGDTRIPRKRVRFRSNKRIVVILKGSFNELLKQPGQLQFRVVNPNNGSGVSSAPQEFKVAGPEVTEAVIKPLKEDETRVKIIISGQNFRNRTTVEFLKAGDVVRQQEPESVTATRLTLTLRAKRVEALGSFEIRAVNPGEVRSNAIAPRHDGIE